MSKWCQFSKIRRTVCLALKVKCKLGNENKNTNQFSESCNSFTSATLRMRNVPTCACESNSYERREKKHKRRAGNTSMCSLCNLNGRSGQRQWQVVHTQTTCEGVSRKALMGWETLLACSRVDKLYASLPACLSARLPGHTVDSDNTDDFDNLSSSVADPCRDFDLGKDVLGISNESDSRSRHAAL